MSKIQCKEIILKAVWERGQLTHYGRITPDFSSATMKDTRAGNELFQGWKVNNSETKILCPKKLSCKTDGEIKVFQERTN